jgi:putative membrane protein
MPRMNAASHLAIARYCTANTSQATGSIHKSADHTVKPVQRNQFPTYNGLRVMAYGPAVMSGPYRVVRVREIVPMWRTAHSRSPSPTTTSRGPATSAHDASTAPLRTSTSSSASGTGNDDRYRNSQAPAGVSEAMAFDSTIQLMRFLLRLLLNGVAIVVTAWLVPGVVLTGIAPALFAGALLGFVNAIIRPILLLLTLPFTLITLGLFIFVVNAICFALTAALVPGFEISGFFAAFFGAILVSVVSWALNTMLPDSERRD